MTVGDRDVEELVAERGIEVDHVTGYGWVQIVTSGDRQRVLGARVRTGTALVADSLRIGEQSSRDLGSDLHADHVVHGRSFSGLRTTQMCLIRSPATSNANTVTVTPSS